MKVIVKRLLLNILLILIAAGAFAVSNTWLLLDIRGGSQMAYLVPGKMKLTFNDSTLVLSSSRFETSFSRAAVLSYRFSSAMDIDDGILMPVIDGYSVQIINDEVNIYGISTSQLLKVYSVDGVLHSPHISYAADHTIVHMSSLPHGTYIITLPGSSIPAVKVAY